MDKPAPTSSPSNIRAQLGSLLEDACYCIPAVNNTIKKLEGTKTVLCMKRDMARTEIRKAAQVYHNLVNQQVRKLEDRLSHLVTEKVNQLMHSQEQLLAHMRSIAAMCNEVERLLEVRHEAELMAEGPRIVQEITELIGKDVGDSTSDHSVLKFVPLQEEQMELEAGALGYIQHHEVDVSNVQVNFLEAGQRASVGVENMMMIVVHTDKPANLLDVIEVRMDDFAGRPIPYVVNDMKDGTLLVQYAPERPGSVRLQVLVYGHHIMASPFIIQVTDVVEIDQVAKRVRADVATPQRGDPTKSRSQSDPGTSRPMLEDIDISAERLVSTCGEAAFVSSPAGDAGREPPVPGASLSCPQLLAPTGKKSLRKPHASEGEGGELALDLFTPAGFLRQGMQQGCLGALHAGGDTCLRPVHVPDRLIDTSSNMWAPMSLVNGCVDSLPPSTSNQATAQAARADSGDQETTTGSAISRPVIKLPSPTKDKTKPDRSVFSMALQSTLQQREEPLSFYSMKTRDEPAAPAPGDRSRSPTKTPPEKRKMLAATAAQHPPLAVCSLSRQSVAPVPMVTVAEEAPVSMVKSPAEAGPGASASALMVKSPAEAGPGASASALGKWLQQNKGQVITGEMRLKIGRFGAASEPLALNFPIGVSATRDNHIVVCANGLDTVKIFDWKGQSQLIIGAPKIKFSRPSAVAISPDGTMFIKDDKQIQAFDVQGHLLHRFGVGILQRPYGLALTPEGNLLVLDHNRGSTVIFSQQGELVAETAYEPMAVMTPNSKFRFLAVHNNKLIAADLGASYVHITDITSGKIVKTIGQPGSKPGEFREPSGVTVDSEGHIVIADSKNDRIQVFHPDGRFAAQVKLSEPIVRPSDIHLHDDRFLLVDNLLQHNVKVYELQLD